jgi:hypothetical protein
MSERVDNAKDIFFEFLSWGILAALLVLTVTAAILSCQVGDKPSKQPPPSAAIADSIATPDTAISYSGRHIWLDWRSKFTIIADQDFVPGIYHGYAVTFDTTDAGILANIASEPFLFGDCRVIYPLARERAYFWPRQFDTILELKYMTGAAIPAGSFGLWIAKTDGRP